MRTLPTPQEILALRKQVYAHFEAHGRVLPWRSSPTPYGVFVSEVMLQQTQVDRVVGYFSRFTTALPSFATLAEAPLATVLSLWQGLGYNRRAVNVRAAAIMVMTEFGGELPNTETDLVRLPGIGTATAGSIAAFGFNSPTVFLETNIRAVLIHHFFANKATVDDSELLPIAEALLDKENPFRWYSAVMDYGSVLKKMVGNAAQKSSGYKKQSTFAGSKRQLRGAVLRFVLLNTTATSTMLKKEFADRLSDLPEVLVQLTNENILTKRRSTYSIAHD